MKLFPRTCIRVTHSFLIALVAAFGLAPAIHAQAPTSTVVGTVTDASKAAVPGASVEARNTATNQVRKTTTSKQGEFTITTLDPGPYEVTITKEGFQAVREEKIELEADQTARVDAALQVGNVTETVAVSASEVGLLNTETSTKGSVITPVEVSEMPLISRDFNDLAFTVPGVQPAEQKAKGANYVANGSRSDSAGIYVDGINDESPRDAGSQISPPLDSIQEFRMETADYTAQYGRLGGSVVNLAIKSGANKFHGSLFDYVRNDLFDARVYNFNPAGVQPKTKLRKNQFGADLSGPIWIPHVYNGRDRTFFNVDLEFLRQVQGTVSSTIVPTLLERSGDFSKSLAGSLPYYFHNPAKSLSAANACDPTGTKVVAGCLYPAPYYKIPTLDPVATRLLAYIPVPNIAGAAPGTNNYQFVSDKISNSSNMLAKLTHKLTERDELQGLFDRNFTYGANPTGSSPLGSFAADSTNGVVAGDFGTITRNHNTLIGLGETHIFSENLVNNFHYGRTRTVSAETANDAGTNYAAQLGINGTATGPSNILGFPSFKPSGAASIGDSASDPVTFVVNGYDGSDLVTWTHHRHNFLVGGDVLHVQLFQPTNSSRNGSFTYNGKYTAPGSTSDALADLLAGYPQQSVLLIGGNTNHLIDTNYSFFAQDDFKASPKLTLNLGVRYELQTLPAEQDGQLINFVPSLGKIVYAGTNPAVTAQIANAGLSAYYVDANTAHLPTALINTNKARLAPRLGFAFRPFDNGKFVVRGGYGLFYTGIRLSVVRTNLAGQFPYAINTTYTASAPSSTKAGSNFISPSSPFPVSGGSLNGILTPNGYDPNAAPAYMQNYNLTVERELPWHVGMEASYVGSKGTHLPQEQDYNQERIANTTASRPLPVFSAITMLYFNGVSHYDSAQISLRRRFQKGLFFRVNYTFGRSLDTQSGANYGGGGGYFANQDVTNPSAEYGLSDFDVRHNFTATVVYRTNSRFYALRGWQLSGIAQFYSGQPFTPTISGTQDLGVATRPNRICNGNLPDPNKAAWFNTACFAAPASGFGSAGRNILIGPDFANINVAAGRVFSLERFGSLEFRLEAFNALNHPNYGYPTAVIGSSTTPGVISSINGNQRLVQLSGRYSF